MKYLYTIAIALMVMSCGKKGNQQNADEQQGDSTSVAQEQNSAGDFKSNDLQTFNLHGDVSEVQTYKSIDGDSNPIEYAAFDEEGRLCKCSAYGPEFDIIVKYKYPGGSVINTDSIYDTCSDCNLVRDEKGRLTHYPHYSLEYDKDGRIGTSTYQSCETDEVFTCTEFNEHGDPVKGTFEAVIEGETAKGTTEYKYLSYDEKGNWTKRSEHSVYDGEEGDAGEDVYIRKITYRK